MATGRIRRTSRRGLALAVIGWMGVATLAVLVAPSASAAPRETVEIGNFTPPVKSVDKGGQLTFVNTIPAQNKGGITLPLVGGVTATVYTDVAVSFFGQNRTLQTGQSATWTFNDPATRGAITYTYRIIPSTNLAAGQLNQLVDSVAGQLPAAPVNVPYVVETLVQLPTLPSLNLPQLPQINVQVPDLPAVPTQPGQQPVVPEPGPATEAPAAVAVAPPAESAPGDQYAYDTGVGAPQLAPSDIVAAAAFDPARYYVPGASLGGVDRAGARGGAGAGGVVGTYDGASVPVFGQLAGLDDGRPLSEAAVDEAAAAAAAPSEPAANLPAAALAAIVALVAVTAALVRLQQTSGSSH